jgi:hypothetical protein
MSDDLTKAFLRKEEFENSDEYKAEEARLWAENESNQMMSVEGAEDPKQTRQREDEEKKALASVDVGEVLLSLNPQQNMSIDPKSADSSLNIPEGEAMSGTEQGDINTALEKNPELNPINVFESPINRILGKGAVEQIPIGIASGFEEAVETIWNVTQSFDKVFRANKEALTGGSITDVVGEYLFGEEIMKPIELDYVSKAFPEPEETSHKMIRSLSKFIGPYLGTKSAMQGIKAVNQIQKYKKAGLPIGEALVEMGASAITTFLTFDPKEDKIVDMVLREHPELTNPFFEYLQSKPGDTVADAKLKAVLEDMVVGGIFESLFMSVGALYRWARSTRAGQKIDETAPGLTIKDGGGGDEPPPIPGEETNVLDLSKKLEESKQKKITMGEQEEILSPNEAFKKNKENQARRKQELLENKGRLSQETRDELVEELFEGALPKDLMDDEARQAMRLRITDEEFANLIKDPSSIQEVREKLISRLRVTLEDLYTDDFPVPDEIYEIRAKKTAKELEGVLQIDPKAADYSDKEVFEAMLSINVPEAMIPSLKQVFSDEDLKRYREILSGKKKLDGKEFLAWVDETRDKVKKYQEEVLPTVDKMFGVSPLSVENDLLRLKDDLTYDEKKMLLKSDLSFQSLNESEQSVILKRWGLDEGAEPPPVPGDKSDLDLVTENLDRAKKEKKKGKISDDVKRFVLKKQLPDKTDEQIEKALKQSKSPDKDYISDLKAMQKEAKEAGDTPPPLPNMVNAEEKFKEAASLARQQRMEEEHLAEVRRSNYLQNVMSDQVELPDSPIINGFRLDKVSGGEDLKKFLMKLADDNAEELNKFRTHQMQGDELEQLAQTVGLTKDQLAGNKRVSYLAEELTKLRMLVNAAGEEAMRLLEIAKNSTDEIDKYNFLKAYKTAQALQKAVVGARSEASNLLNSLKYKVGSTDFDAMNRVMEDVLNSEGLTSESIDKMFYQIQKVKDKTGASSGEALNKIIAKKGSRLGDSAFEYFINNLTSAAAFGVNLFSGPTSTFLRSATRRWAATFHKGPITNEAVNYSLTGGQKRFTGRMSQFYSDISDAFLLFKESWAAKESMFDKRRTAEIIASREGIVGVEYEKRVAELMGNLGPSQGMFDQKSYNSITAENYNKNSDDGIGRVINFLGSAIRTPSRLLTAQDDFFKALNYAREKRMYAVVSADELGLKGLERTNHIHQEILRPSQDLNLRAFNSAKESTLTQKLEKGGFAHSFKQFLDTPSIAPVARYIMPFIRIPMNEVIEKMRYNPLMIGLASGADAAARAELPFVTGLKDNILVRDLVGDDPIKKQLAWAKFSMGSSATFLVATAVWNGKITGNGPRDPEARKRMESYGWRPNSFQLGNMYIPLKELGYFGGIIRDMANLSEMGINLVSNEQDDVYEDLGSAFIATLMDSVTPEYFAQTMGDVAELLKVDEPDKFWNIVGRIAANQVVPFSQLQRSMENVIMPKKSQKMPKYTSALDIFYKQIELNSLSWSGETNLGNDVNIWGEKVYNQPGIIGAAMSVVFQNANDRVIDDVEQELIELGLAGAFFRKNKDESEIDKTFNMPGREFSFQKLEPGGSKSVETRAITLTGQEYARYIQLINKPHKDFPSLKEALRSAMNDGYYKRTKAGNKKVNGFSSRQRRAMVLMEIYGRYKKAGRKIMHAELLKKYPTGQREE